LTYCCGCTVNIRTYPMYAKTDGHISAILRLVPHGPICAPVRPDRTCSLNFSSLFSFMITFPVTM
jgi:hypothetical protein